MKPTWHAQPSRPPGLRRWLAYCAVYVCCGVGVLWASVDLYPRLIGTLIIAVIFVFMAHQIYRGSVRKPILGRDGAPVWCWVHVHGSWGLARIEDDSLQGPCANTIHGRTRLGDIRSFGPRPCPPSARRGRIKKAEPGWHWVMVEEGVWECGRVLWYDAHGGPAGTLVDTPMRSGRVHEVVAWGEQLEPPEITDCPRTTTGEEANRG